MASLLGIDVGYSATRATTGIAVYRAGEPLRLSCVRTDTDARSAAIGNGPFDAVAIDGPLVPLGHGDALRHCEAVLSRGAFGKRCRAGYSHFGDGLKLRDAARNVAADVTAEGASGMQIVEAFPNAFLAVLLDETAFAQMPAKIPRGTKSDLYYARAAASGCFDRLFAHLRWQDDTLLREITSWAAPQTRIAHEYRSAITCLLTAACALAEISTTLGDAAGGKIHLPPLALWAPWARDAYAASRISTR